ncbi:hypothetical protein AKO1_008207, partial [Acrasis kona]
MNLHSLIELHWTSKVAPKNLEVLLYNNKIRIVDIKCGLQIIPFDGYQCLHITRLDLSNCNLQYLPNTIGALKNLTVLNILNNKNFQLSPNIGLLSSLSELRVSGGVQNERGIMTEVPSTLHKLLNLRVLMIRNTSISMPPQNIE